MLIQIIYLINQSETRGIDVINDIYLIIYSNQVFWIVKPFCILNHKNLLPRAVGSKKRLKFDSSLTSVFYSKFGRFNILRIEASWAFL